MQTVILINLHCECWLIVCLLPYADSLSNSLFSFFSARNIISESTGLDPDQAQPIVGPDLDPNGWRRQTWSLSRQRVNP